MPHLGRRLGKKTIWVGQARPSSSYCHRPRSFPLSPSPSSVPGQAASGSAPSRGSSGCSLASSHAALALSHVVAGALFDASQESPPPALVS